MIAGRSRSGFQGKAGRGIVSSLALLALACAHASQLEQPSQATPPPSAQAQPAQAQPARAQPAPSRPAPPPAGHPALSPSPAGTFQGGAVERIQSALRHRGFRAPETGRLDEATQGELARFQRQQGLAPTGFPDDATLEKLGLDPAELHKSTAQ